MDTDFIINTIVTLVIVGGVVTLWKSLFFLIAKKVEITIEENQISFLAEGKTLVIAPYVYISKNRKRNRLLGIGNPPTSGDDFFTVNILTPQGEINFNTTIEACVEAFFRSAFYLLFNRKVLLYTVATVTGAEKFKDTFGENYVKSLDKCLKSSGSIKREYT